MNDDGETGLVPATYIEETNAAPAPVPTSTPGRAQQGSGEQGPYRVLAPRGRDFCSIDDLPLSIVRALYPYQAQGADELSLKEGDILELSSGIHGGKDYAEGWWEGELFICLYNRFGLI
jgi:hypothetical protein